MPLLRRDPFKRIKPPTGLRPDEEVFYCKLTGEIFTDYEKFFERVILCNSLVWACSATGRSGLTFQEALDSERKAKQQLDNFPEYLQRPILFLARMTHRSRLNDMNDDIFMFMKDRYFAGEIVEAYMTQPSGKKMCEIVKVIASSGGQSSGNAAAIGESSSDSSDVICLDDDLQPETKKMKLSDSPAKPSGDIQSTTYDYLLQEVKSSTAMYVMPAEKIGRKKGVLTRDKCKLFLRQHCDPEGDGIWKVKEKYVKKFKLSEISFEAISSGPLPIFEVSEAKKKPAAKIVSNVIDLTSDDEGAAAVTAVKNNKEEKEKKRKDKLLQEAKLHEAEKERLKKLKNQAKKDALKVEEELRLIRQAAAEKNLAREKEKQERLDAKLAKKEEMKKKAEEERQKKKEEREREKEEKRKQDILKMEWNRPRDDLECDDLKGLPTSTPIDCCFPSEIFGDVVLVLEYLSSFKTLFDLDLPKDLSLDSLGKALSDTEVDGLYSTIVSSLLSTIFRYQEEELDEGDGGNDEKDWKGLPGFIGFEDRSLKELVKSATSAAQLPMQNYGTPLRSLQLDNYTVSEILRLHLLASGSTSLTNCKFDYQQRGGYTPYDDPGIEFRRQELATLRSLAVKNVFDLAPSEKAKILMVLVHQLLTYAVSRDFIEDNLEKLKHVQRNLRLHQMGMQRRERDETQYWLKKKQEEKVKGIETQGQMNGEVASVADEKSSTEVEKIPDPEPPSKKGRPKKSDNSLTDKDFEGLPMDGLDWEKITKDERSQMREWEQRREREMTDELNELQLCSPILPIGLDRTYRRFWVFHSLPGVFIEDQDEYILDDMLIPATQVSNDNLDIKNKVVNGDLVQNKDISLEDSTSEGEKSTTSDKENVPVDGIDGNRGNQTINSNDNQNKIKFTSVQDQVASRGQVRWSFYSLPEELDELIESLNTRGNREGPLRTALVEQRDRLVEGMKSGVFAGFCPSKQDSNPVTLEKRGKIRSKTSLPFSKFVTAHENLENCLREMFLDMEERIYNGTLGALKINNRVEWRLALQESRYDQLNSSISFNGKKEARKSTDPTQRCYVDLGLKDEQNKVEIIDVDNNRECVLPVVKDLAMALLHIEQMVDHRYLKRPLGEETGSKKSKQKANHESKKEKDSKKKKVPTATLR